MSEVDTVLEDWYLISFVHQGKPVARVLYGKVVVDHKRRFGPGKECHTSPIEEEISAPGAETRTFRTQNTIYELTGPGCEMEATMDKVPLLRSGIHPLDWDGTTEAMEGLKRQGYKIEGLE